MHKVEHRVNENHLMKEPDFTEPRDDEAFGYVNTVFQPQSPQRFGCSSPCCTNSHAGFQYSKSTPRSHLQDQGIALWLWPMAPPCLCHKPFNIKT